MDKSDIFKHVEGKVLYRFDRPKRRFGGDADTLAVGSPRDQDMNLSEPVLILVNGKGIRLTREEALAFIDRIMDVLSDSVAATLTKKGGGDE